MKNIAEVLKKETKPVRILQIGEGNFLRAFAEVLIDEMNEKNFNGSVIICQPRGEEKSEKINAQNGFYTVITRGKINGKAAEDFHVVKCVDHAISLLKNYEEFLNLAKTDTLDVIISNTTEAGISLEKGDEFFPVSYPAKLAEFLKKRYEFFGGDLASGLLILPVELVENNGALLKQKVLEYISKKQYEKELKMWIENACFFANTLVDRIVSGFPEDESEELQNKLGYTDELIDVCEPFFFWAIEADKKFVKKFPAENLSKKVVFSDNISLYKMRKVRMLNGAHTLSVLAAFSDGYNTVKEMLADEKYATLIHRALHEEIIPFIPLPQEDKEQFATDVAERFANPFLEHRLLDIALNSVSKFRTRCIPSLLDYYAAYGAVPPCLCFGLAALIRFYDGEEINGRFYGRRGNEFYEIRDEKQVIDFFKGISGSEDRIECILANSSLWGCDLTELDGLEDAVKSVCYYL